MRRILLVCLVLLIAGGIAAWPFLSAYTAGTPAADRPSLPARSDFFLLGRSLAPLSEALRLSRLTRRVIVRVLAMAGLYNIVTVSLALAGYMSPLACALAMPASSLVIILTTVRAYRPRTHDIAAVEPVAALEVPAR